MKSQAIAQPGRKPEKFADAKVIGLVGVAHALSHFYHLLLVPLFPWIKAEFGLSYAELGLLMTAFFVASGLVQAAAGFAVDKIGASPVLFAGIGCMVIAALTLGLAPSPAWLLIGSTLAGMGNGVFHPADYSLLNHRVAGARLGYAFSMHGIAGTLGWAAAPVFLLGINGLAGWRAALLGAAILAAAVLLLLAANRSRLAYPLAGRRQAAPAGKAETSTGPANGAFGFLRLPQVWMCWGFMFLTTIALAGFQSFAALALTQMYAMPLAVAAASYTIYMLSSAGGMLLGGYANTRVASPDRLILVCFVIAGLLALLVAWPILSAAVIPVLLGVLGFCSGVANPSRDLLVRMAAPEGAIGRVYGIVYSGLDIGLAVGPVAYGMLMDAGQPNMVFVVIGIFQLLAIFTAVSVGGGNRRRSAAAAPA